MSSLGRSAPERLGGRRLFATVPRGVAEGRPSEVAYLAESVISHKDINLERIADGSVEPENFNAREIALDPCWGHRRLSVVGNHLFLTVREK